MMNDSNNNDKANGNDYYWLLAMCQALRVHYPLVLRRTLRCGCSFPHTVDEEAKALQLSKVPQLAGSRAGNGTV